MTLIINLADHHIPQVPFKLALAQTVSDDGEIEANTKRAVALIRSSAKAGAQLVVFPEKYLTGYVPELVQSNPEKDTITLRDSRLDSLRQACRVNKIAAIIGSPTSEENGQLHISSIVIDAMGRERGRYHKMNLFSSEKLVYAPGTQLMALQFDDWKMGMGICYDSGFPEHARLLAQAGCHADIVSALFSQGNGYQEAQVWFPARALDNTIFTAMTNYVGPTGDWQACGSSGAWDPFGKLITRASETEPELVLVTLNPTLIQQTRDSERMLFDA